MRTRAARQSGGAPTSPPRNAYSNVPTPNSSPSARLNSKYTPGVVWMVASRLCHSSCAVTASSEVNGGGTYIDTPGRPSAAIRRRCATCSSAKARMEFRKMVPVPPSAEPDTEPSANFPPPWSNASDRTPDAIRPNRRFTARVVSTAEAMVSGITSSRSGMRTRILVRPSAPVTLTVSTCRPKPTRRTSAPGNNAAMALRRTSWRASSPGDLGALGVVGRDSGPRSPPVQPAWRAAKRTRSSCTKTSGGPSDFVSPASASASTSSRAPSRSIVSGVRRATPTRSRSSPAATSSAATRVVPSHTPVPPRSSTGRAR
jgi:hypothetical protein